MHIFISQSETEREREWKWEVSRFALKAHFRTQPDSITIACQHMLKNDQTVCLFFHFISFFFLEGTTKKWRRIFNRTNGPPLHQSTARRIKNHSTLDGHGLGRWINKTNAVESFSPVSNVSGSHRLAKNKKNKNLVMWRLLDSAVFLALKWASWWIGSSGSNTKNRRGTKGNNSQS